MSCASVTLTGIALDCGNVGGVKKLYIANVADVSTIAYGADGEVTAMTMAAGAKFKTFSFQRGNASFTSSGAKDIKNGTYFASTDITAQFNRMDKAKRTEMVNLAKANAIAIVQDNNDTYWLIGNKDNHLSLTTGAGQSGAEKADGNFYNIVLTAETPELPCTVASGIISALIA